MTTERPVDDDAVRAITARVAWSQALWVAGYSLTTGPFLSYFGQDLGARGVVTALLLIVPETAGVLGLLTRPLIRRFQGRKRVWLVFSLIARGCSLGIPLAGLPFVRGMGIDPLALMVASLALSQAANAIVYVAYLAWFADAVPATRWGRFFAVRNIAELAVLMIVPIAGGYLRDWWKGHAAAEALPWFYAGAYLVGFVLLIVSMIPLLAIQDRPASPDEREVGEWRNLRRTFSDRSLRCLLLHNWWLAFANGLTQAAFFRYMHGPLAIGLGTTYVLNDVMHCVGIPVSWATGVIADRRGNKGLMIAGVFVASSALLFWLRADATRWWWLFGAYACFGAFPAVNITGRNLVLELAPRGDNTNAMALFRQVGGLLAGLSGLLGGFWLERLEARGAIDWGLATLNSYQTIFLVSLAGRWTSVLWLLPIRERRDRLS